MQHSMSALGGKKEDWGPASVAKLCYNTDEIFRVKSPELTLNEP